MSGLVLHHRAISNLHDQRIEVDTRLERLKRLSLPGLDLLADLVGGLADRFVTDLGADGAGLVMLDHWMVMPPA
jgi:hypothetical protein